MLPAWLRWDEEVGKHAVIPERAEVINVIFEKADQGWGQHRIAQWLNESRIPTWGGNGEKQRAEHWHRSYVRKLLTNGAVTGTFTPHQRIMDADGKRRRKSLDPIHGYFPVVVPEDLFERVAARARTIAARGRNAAVAPASIFAGLLRCARCGGVATRVSKGQQVYLVCSRANRKGTQACKYQAVRYSHVEDALLQNADVIISEAPLGPETEKLEDEIANLDVVIDIISDEARDIADELLQEKSSLLRARLREKEAELEAARAKLSRLNTEREKLARPYVRQRLAALLQALQRKPFNVTDVNRALKAVVSKIVLDPEAAHLTLHWHHSSVTTDDVPFFSRHSKLFDKVLDDDSYTINKGR
jgi:hypothetical protein